MKPITQNERKNTKKIIDEGVTNLRESGRSVGNLNDNDPVALEIYNALGNLSDSTKSNYLSSIRKSLRENKSFSTNPTQENELQDKRKQRNGEATILESHLMTKNLNSKCKLAVILPEIISLIQTFEKNQVTQEMLDHAKSLEKLLNTYIIMPR